MCKQLPKIKPEELVEGYSHTCGAYPGNSSSFCPGPQGNLQKVIFETSLHGCIRIHQVHKGDQEMGRKGGMLLAQKIDQLLRKCKYPVP